MRIHFIIHAHFELAGAIERWAVSKGHTLSLTHTYKGEKLPDVSAFDFLVVMGGPQSPIELDKYPYLRDEISITKQAIDHNKAVLGVCLGAQIIAESLGATTERSPNKEVGVYPVQVTNEGMNDSIFKLFPKTFDVMHWHNDMPGLPRGAVLLAYSEGCPRQAVRFNDRTYGLQFHMEMTPELVRGMTEHCAEDLQPGKYIQDKNKILSADLKEMNDKVTLILNHLAGLVSSKKMEHTV